MKRSGNTSLTPNSRLRWRQRRGMKELDILLERWFKRHYETATPKLRDAFARLLDHEDPEIWLWVVEQAPVPPEFADVIAALRRHD